VTVKGNLAYADGRFVGPITCQGREEHHREGGTPAPHRTCLSPLEDFEADCLGRGGGPRLHLQFGEDMLDVPHHRAVTD
jgi:hypothetical protein